MWCKGFIYLFVAIIVVNPCIAQQPQAEPNYTAPVTAFSQLPAFTNIQLSPNGKNIAYVQNIGGNEPLAVLAVYDAERKESKYLLTSDNKKVKINWYRWVNNDVIVISARYESKSRSVLYYQTRMFSLDLTSEELEQKPVLEKRRSMRDISAQYTSQFQDSVIDFLPDDPEHIMVEVDYDVPQKPSVYKVNIYTSKKSRIEKGKLDIRSWITDQQHQVRIGRARDFNTGEVTYYHRFSEDEDLTKLLSYISFDDKPISILGFDLDPNIIYLTKYNGDKRALYKMDLTSKETTLLLAHEDYDVGNSLIYSGTTKEALGLYDYHSPYGRFYFDDNSYEFHRALDAALPDTKNYIRSFSDNEQVYLLYVESDSVSGQYLLGDRTKGSLEYLFSSYPDLDFVTLPKHQKITYTSRDGMEIEALLTLPKFGKAPYPTVVHPHGGPGARDSSGFDPWVSYMSSKGYAVVRPNFRGSSGYGFEFAQAQMKGWGLEMQDDITDATTQLIEKGVIDKSRVCIFGASYGGYAALMATTKTPDLFTCAVSFAGVSDLRDLSRNQQRFSGGDLVAEKQLGDDRRDLLERSPITYVKNIKTPLLIMHGTEDRSVPVNQSREFVEALKDQNKVHKYVEFDYGDHYLSIASNRTLFFDELDAFFNQHLGKVE